MATVNIIITGKLNIKLAIVFAGFVVLQTSILSFEEVSALRLSKTTTQGVDPTPFSTSTIAYGMNWPSSVRCAQLAIQVAHQKYLCKSRSASAYMKLAKAQYTCEDRCGDTPVFRKDLLNCACDEVCIVYGDCCRDISIVCPQIHATGKAHYAHFMNKVTPSCHDNNFAVLRESAPRCLSSTIPTADNAATTLSETGRGKDNAGVASMLLKNIFGSFKFRDLSLNVVSNNFGTFELLAKHSSVPLVVPQEASLLCAGVSSKDYGSAANVFQSCTVHRVTDVASPLSRNCKVYQIITCRCEDGKKFEEHVHNICMSQKFTAFRRHTHSLGQFGDTEHCDVFNATDLGTYHPLAARDLNKKGYKIKVTPMFPELKGLFQGNNSQSRDRDCDQQVQDTSGLAARDVVDREDVYYIVELEKTLEKRLRCPSLDMSLTECSLEECIQGAIMFKANFGNFGNRSCVLPALATVLAGDSHVTVPVCSCFRALAALAALEIWRLQLRLSGGATCSFHLRALDKVATDLRNDPFDVGANNTGLAVETRFQKLYKEASTNCSEEAATEKNLQVCFYTAREMSQTQAKPTLCFNASPNVRFLRRNSGKRTGDVSFLMLTPVFMAIFAWFSCLVL